MKKFEKIIKKLNVVFVSSVKGTGIDEFRNTIVDMALNSELMTKPVPPYYVVRSLGIPKFLRLYLSFFPQECDEVLANTAASTNYLEWSDYQQILLQSTSLGNKERMGIPGSDTFSTIENLTNFFQNVGTIIWFNKVP